MIQPILSICTLTLSTTQTQYHPILTDLLNANEGSATGLIASPGTISSILVNLDVDPGGSASRTFTFRLDGVDQTLTCTINAGSRTARLVGNAISVIAGQRVSIKSVPTNTPVASAATFYVEFTPTSGNKSVYGGTWQLSQLSGTRYSHPLKISNTDSTVSTTTNVLLQQPIPGSYTAIYAHWTALPAAGVGGTLNLVLDGVVQDGTGGTVNTTVSMVAIQNNNAIFNLPVTDTSELTLQVIMNAAGAFLQNLEIGIEFTASQNNQSILAGHAGALNSNVAPTYSSTTKSTVNVWGGSEDFSHQNPGGISTFTLSVPRFKMDVSPGSGKSRIILIRKNNASPIGGPTITFSDSDIAKTGTGSVSIADGDTFGWEQTPSGAPTSATLSTWALAMNADTPPDSTLPFITEIGAMSF